MTEQRRDVCSISVMTKHNNDVCCIPVTNDDLVIRLGFSENPFPSRGNGGPVAHLVQKLSSSPVMRHKSSLSGVAVVVRRAALGTLDLAVTSPCPGYREYKWA